MGTDHSSKIIRRLRQPRQDRADLDVEPGPARLLDGHEARVRRRHLEGQLELERERAGGQWGRQCGAAVQGDAEGRVGADQGDYGVE